ncbi:MAG: PAS domain S-box protein, partial [Magnetococcales bacterium]|nr:PAS domain S-box protein [Magnetococcales bacterium]
MKQRETILIVDDERFNINLLRDLLDEDYDTMVARHGQQALQRVRAGTPPDLILLDIMMPEMDGYEVCQRLQADPETSEIPIIFITAMNQVGDEAKGLELGAVDYVTKPISPDLLKLRIRNHLKIRQQSAALKALLQQQMKDHAQLKKSQSNLERAQAIANFGSWDWDLGTDAVHLSFQAFNIIGLHPNDFQPTLDGLLESVPPEERETVHQLIRNAVERPEDRFDKVHRIIRPDGEVLHVHEVGEVIRNEAGDPLFMTAIIHDVTKRRAAEHELHRHRDNLTQLVTEKTARVKAIVETAVDSIITIDQRGIIETVNPAVQRMFGWSPEELVGKNVSMLIPDSAIRAQHDSFLTRYLETKERHIIGMGR